MILARRFGIVAAWVLVATMFSLDARADGFSTIYAFKGGSDGEFPEGGLISDGSGKLYGTTFGSLAGGAPGKHCPKSCGSVYDLIDDQGSGVVTQLYPFEAGGGDGAFPTGEVVIDASTTLFGTTEYGTGTGCGGLGCGTVFMIPNDGTGKESIIRFCQLAGCADGVFPHAGLINGVDGNLYGTTTFGGMGNGWLCGSSWGGCGVVYRPVPATKSVMAVYSFCTKVNKGICLDGAVPYAGVVTDDQGNLYGTTQFGGKNLGGTIFKLTSDGKETVLHAFCAKVQNNICTDGSVPQAAPIFYAGKLYGTTKFGGTACDDNPGCGVIYRISPDGSGYTVLYRFSGGAADGSLPEAPLVADGTGLLYGTTFLGGGGQCVRGERQLGCGVLFQLSAKAPGPDTILHAFTVVDKTDGSHPVGALALLGNTLYGATEVRGDPVCSCGTLFSFALPARRLSKSSHLH